MSRTLDSSQVDRVNERIAANVRGLRSERGLSLDALARACGVSRSALSLIERAESSPTAVVLDRIAAGLGVSLSSLFETASGTQDDSLVVRRADQPVWRDPSSGYLRRSVSPGSAASPIRIVEVTFPAGARVGFEAGDPGRAVCQQLWLLQGTIYFSLGDDTYRLRAGDCVAARLDRPTMFHNPTAKDARYAVVMVAEPGARR